MGAVGAAGPPDGAGSVSPPYGAYVIYQNNDVIYCKVNKLIELLSNDASRS